MDNPNVQAADYPPVTIHNSTQYIANGTVVYASIFCRDDNYTVTPNVPWKKDRGVCLITRITATVQTPQGNIQATPYTSSGTSYSQFAIIQTGANSFMVTRLTEGSEDQRPEGYVEPTTQQK